MTPTPPRSLPPAVLACLALLSCGEAPLPTAAAEPAPFRHSISQQLQVPGKTSRALAAARSAQGLTHLYAADEVLIAPKNRGELEAFLKRTGGTVIGDDAIPPPPPGANLPLRAVSTGPTQYIVRVDASQVALDELDTHAARAGLSGEIAFSDEKAARLLALVAREKAQGLSVSPNFVFEASLITSTQEHPAGTGFFNAFNEVQFATTGSRTNMQPLFQLVDARPPTRRSFVAVIDGGFWLDPTGKPFTSRTDGTWASDFPESPLQYDFVQGDYLADGPNLGLCTGGIACNWHGNDAASAATGRFNNRYGSTGTAGQVADPMLFKTSLDWGQTSTAIRTAVAWGADVISMSFGANCDNAFCDAFFETHLYPALRNARDNGVVMVAAAGNEAESANGKVPCKAAEDVICVGALEDGTQLATGYSNWGTSVDIWAPTNLAVQPNGDSTPNLDIFGGTSASTPFVAGVAALMRAYNPGLTSAQVNTFLRNTAWVGSTDPKVTHAINAYAAFRQAIPGLDAPPHAEVRLLAPYTTTVDLNRSFSVRAVTKDLEDGEPCCTVTWSPTPTLTSDNGRSAVFTFTSTGNRILTALVRDSSGATFTATRTVSVVNTPPTARIQQPVGGSSVYALASVQLLGSATDINEPGEVLACSRLQWTSSNSTDTSFPISGCDVRVTFRSTGSRTLTLTATDPQGRTGQTTVSLYVMPAPVNRAPDITFGTLPPTNYADGYDSSLLFQVSARATDAEGNTPISYRWKARSFRPGTTTPYAGPVYITSATTVSGNLSWRPDSTPSLLGGFSVFGNACYNGQDVLLELEATDSLGNRSTRALQLIKVFLCRL